MQAHDDVTLEREWQALRASLGDVILDALDDADVVEIMVNPDGGVWVERVGEDPRRAGEMAASSAESIIRLVAHHIGETANSNHPEIAGTLPRGGERFEGLLPPLVAAPSITIRKRPARIFPLSDYVDRGIMTETQADTLRRAAVERKNILIAGGTGSGKTTLANAVLAEPAFSNDRILMIEDTAELQCAASNQVQLLTKRTTPVVDMTALLRATLRMRPDRIVIGEVRGRECLDMIKAWNTGHPGGLCTIHANSAEDAVRRIEELVGEVSQVIPHRSIAGAIDYVVYVERTREGRRVRGISAVTGWEDGVYRFRSVEGTDVG